MRNQQLTKVIGPYGSEGWVQYRVELPSVAEIEQRPVVNVNFGGPSLDRENWYTATCCNGIGNALLEFSNTTFERTDPPLIGKFIEEEVHELSLCTDADPMLV